MISTANGRRLIGLYAWFILCAATLFWLWDARASLHPLIWALLLAPFAALLPGLLAPTRNSWLLALLATVGYASIGFMDAIANPDSITAASVLAAGSLIAFFLMIPAIRTMPSPPKPPPEP
ncbi:MAG: hypothetical protein AAAFM81_01570 [Pseudomonadota bacterium]